VARAPERRGQVEDPQRFRERYVFIYKEYAHDGRIYNTTVAASQRETDNNAACERRPEGRLSALRALAA
jgi:hypothetical protein